MPPASSPVEGQAVGTPSASLGLPPPSWPHPRDSAPGVSPSGLWAVLLAPQGSPQPQLITIHCWQQLPPGTTGEAGTCYGYPAPASLGFPS